MKKQICCNEAPVAIGPYSQGIQIGDLFFFSGQIPINQKTNKIAEGIEKQTIQVLENIKVLLNSQQLDFEQVIKTTVFLKNMDDFTIVNTLYENYFTTPYPARSAIEVSRLPKDVLIEIELIASK